MAVGPIQFSVSTNPIDALNDRLLAMGRAEIVTEVRTTPRLDCRGHYHDITYIARNGERRTYGTLRGSMDSTNDIVANFLTHVSAVEKDPKVRADMEYQQYLDDHKAMTLGTLFGENRFPRARERAFLDFRTVAAPQSYFSDDRNYKPRDAEIRKVLCTFFLEEMVENCGASVGDAMIHLRWKSNSKTIRVPLSRDMPWFTAAQQARDTLREWIDTATQKNAVQEKFGKGEIKLNVPNDCATQQGTTKQEAATASNDYIVSIWDINYPKARVEYREGIEALPSRFGFTGTYKAGAKVSGIPRTEEPFDTTLKYAKGDTVVLRNCSWVTDGEVQCERIETNGKSAPMPGELLPQRVAAEQQIPKGVMVSSDGEVVGKATPARGMAYLNGVPVGVMTNIEYDGTTVRLNADGEGRVTTTAQQVRDAIDRGMKANSVPSVYSVRGVAVDPQIGDNNNMQKEAVPIAECMSEWQQYVHDHTLLRAGKLLEIFDCALPRAREWAYAHSEREHPNTVEQYASSNFCEVDWYAGKSLIENYLRLRGIAARVETDKTRWSDEKLAVARISVRGITLDHTISKQENTWIRIAWEMFTRIAPALGMSLDNAPAIGDTVPKETSSMPTLGSNESNPSVRQRATAEAIEVAYRTAAIKLPELVRKQLVKRMATKGGKRPSQARLSLAEDMLSGDEGSLIVAGILSLALSASPEFIKSKMPWLDLTRLATALRLDVETRIACAVADMLGMYLDGALEALKEAFGGSQQLLLAEGGKSDESALFNGVPKAETVRV